MRRHKNIKILSVNMIGFLTFSLLILLIVTDVAAAPAAPIVMTLSQPDGNEFKAVTWGDEWLNGMETLEGYTIYKDPLTNYWAYLTPSSVNSFKPETRDQTQLACRYHIQITNPSSK